MNISCQNRKSSTIWIRQVFILTFAFLCFLLPIEVIAQQKFQVSIKGDSVLQKKYSGVFFTSQKDVQDAITKEYNDMLLQGYFDARIDTLSLEQGMQVTIDKGKAYYVDIKSTGTKENPKVVYLGKYMQNKAEERLTELENNGYPFAYVQYKSIDSSQIFMYELSETPGPLFLFDSLIVKGDGKVPQRYVQHYLSFRKGKPYDESWIRGVDQRLNQIPFLRTLKSSEVLFKKNQAVTYVYLTKKNANYFNGILGIQPNQNTGKTNITGDLELRLFNILNAGDELYFNWRKLQPQTQDLKAKLLIPFIAGLPIGTEGNLNIFRRDTTFTNFRTTLALVHIMGGFNRIKVFVEKTSSNRLASVSTGNNLANVDATLYGIGFTLEQLDYKYNPRKGFTANAEVAAGNKRASVGASDVGGPQEYNQYRAEGNIGLFIPTWKRQTIHVGIISGTIISPAIYTTEMYRFGGLNTMRGLDEESIFASSFARVAFEYRYILDRNSNVYLFTDQAWYERRYVNETTRDTPLGFGAGVSFETNAGIFLFNYALGQEFDNPILVRNGKISFGFRNVF